MRQMIGSDIKLKFCPMVSTCDIMQWYNHVPHWSGMVPPWLLMVPPWLLMVLID